MRWTAWTGGAMLALAVATTALAADVTGKWKAQYQTPDGQQRESTFTFRGERRDADRHGVERRPWATPKSRKARCRATPSPSR